jgi:hypothetical protein
MNKPSRRAVVRTGVWAVPVVATAAAVPAFAGTVDNCAGQVCLSAVGASCKLPGHSTHNGTSYYGYRMNLTFFNDSGADQVVTVTSFTISGADTILDPLGTTFTVPGTCTTASGGCDGYILFVQSTNSAQRNATVCFTAQGQNACASVTFPSFNPCKCDPKEADPTDPASNCA